MTQEFTDWLKSEHPSAYHACAEDVFTETDGNYYNFHTDFSMHTFNEMFAWWERREFIKEFIQYKTNN